VRQVSREQTGHIWILPFGPAQKQNTQFCSSLHSTCQLQPIFTMSKLRKLIKSLKNPLFSYGIPTVGIAVLGTLFVSELVKINRLIVPLPSGVKEEDLVDSFDVNTELQVC
jgi:hypothetical protein